MSEGPSEEVARAAADLKVVVGRIARRLRQAHEVGELHLSEVSVLSRLDREGPTTPGQLADSEAVRPQAMATTVAALEQRGLVTRKPDVADGRKVLIEVTDTGRTLIQDRRSASIQRIAVAMQAEFDDPERAALMAMVPLLDRLAERL